MLKITRKVGEAFKLFTRNGEVNIKVSRMTNAREVELEIQAPMSIDIRRNELEGNESNGN
jgi:sRNA-binding carbon storage regulator CsrA